MDSMQSNEERGAERQMDEYLKSIGFHRKKIAKDGSCLFRAVAEQVLHCQSLHTKVRAKCVEFLKKNRESYEAFIEGDFEDYLFKLQDPQQWVGEVEIHALAVMYKRDFQIFQEPAKPAVNITDHGFKDKVRLCFLNGNHYDSVYPISHLKNTALCQSVLFELLYDDVFKVDRSALSVCQRTGRPHDLLIDDNMNACPSSDESDLDTKEPLWVENGTNTTAPRHNNRGRGRGRLLSERVRRSLNPTLLRNIEYDVWQKSKRAQQKLDYCIAAGMQFSAGDRCQVRLEGSGRSYNATVKEVPPDNGPVTVYIEELGRKQVPVWSLRPPCDENSWSTVVNRDKRLSNGHGDGRGRGKHVPASSSVPAAQGSTGRVQKQHSWPPQAAAEEQGGAKSTRKSVSSVEPSFGLTEQQRLAKEEEKRNVALVEIQLRDEQSFPALGSQSGGAGDGGKKKGDKRRSQRNKTKSPVEDARAPSPSTGERPKSSTPPLITAATNMTPPTAHPAALSVNSDPSAADPTVKPNAPSYASAAKASPSSPPPLPASIPSSASHFSFITPVLPAASSPPSSSSLPPKSSPSPPLSSPVAPPTFIAPIAPSSVEAQSLLHPSSLTRSSPPVVSLPHSPSPPPVSSSSSQFDQAPPAAAPPQNSLPNPGDGTLQYQTPPPQIALPEHQSQIPAPLTQTQASSTPNQPTTAPAVQQGPQPHTEAPPPLPPPQSHPQHPHQSQPEGVQVQSSHQVSDPVSQPPVAPPPSSQTQEEAPAPAARPQPESAPHQPHPTSLQGAVPLQQLSQLYQDPLYPGFPLGEKGEIVQTPPLSCSRTGDDLPQEINVLRFFYNLGVKAYSMPIIPPYIYLLPLQQTHAIQPRIPSRSPSPTPHYPPSNPPQRPQEPYTHHQYPPTSAPLPLQYNPQAPPADPPHHSDPPYSQAGYPPPHRMQQLWQQQQMLPPRNPNFPVGYPTPNPAYPIPQGYHPGQNSLYPSSLSPYPPSSLAYQPSSASEELQMSQGPVEQHQPPNGHIMPGQRPIQTTSLLGSPGATVANANNSLPMMVSGFGHKKEHGESLSRPVLLGEQLINNSMLVSNAGNASVSMAAMKPSNTPGTSAPYDIMFSAPTPSNNNPTYGYHGHPKPPNPTTTNFPLGAPEASQVDYLANVTMAEGLSVGCSTEDDWEEHGAFKPPNSRGQRRYPRGGGRGRGGHDSGRGPNRRRYGADGGAGSGYVQFHSSHRGRGRERGY